MMIINNSYSIGDVVYLKTDVDQRPRMITCIKVFPNELLYQVACGTYASDHYDFEISSEKEMIVL